MNTVNVLLALSALCFAASGVIFFFNWRKTRRARKLVMKRLNDVLAASRKPVERFERGGYVKPQPLPPVTDWFPHTVPPVHEGRYQVRTVAGVAYTFADWNGKEWRSVNDDSPLAIQALQWRGLTAQVL